MRFCIEHTYVRTSLARYLEVYFSDAFNRHIDPHIGVEQRQRLERQELDHGRVRCRTRVVPVVRLPGLLRRLSGLDRIAYVEESTFDPRGPHLDFCIEHAASRYLKVWGVIRFDAAGVGVRRRVEVEVEVQVGLPGVRPMVERFIEVELRQAFDRKAVLMQQWLDASAEQAPASRPPAARSGASAERSQDGQTP